MSRPRTLIPLLLALAYGAGGGGAGTGCADNDGATPPDAGVDGGYDAGLDGEPPSLSAEAWPEADQLFEQDARWIGGDAAYTVDLGGDRILWLMGDSFIATSTARLRSESVMVENSVGLQVGRDPTTATMSFHWDEPSGPDLPEAYFHEPTDYWLWPLDGARLEDKVLVFFTRLEATGQGLGFEAVDWQARLIENPDDAPDQWIVTKLSAPANPDRIIVGTGVTVHDGYLVAYSMQEPSHDIFLIRWPVHQARLGQLDAYEWWCGDDTWEADCAAAPLFESGPPELSVHRDPGSGWWLFTQTIGFGDADLHVRLAPDPLGPWTDPIQVFRPPENDWDGASIYAGKAHPELTGADAVLTYMANNSDFATLVNDQRYYYPRFVRLTVDPARR